jgi:lambda repressor-like predicted transcriptional regulator
MTTSKQTKKDADRWAIIKCELELRGHSLASIARELGVDRSAPQSVRRKRYPKMQAAIAERLGVAPESLWPERYEGKLSAPRGEARKTMRRRKSAA